MTITRVRGSSWDTSDNLVVDLIGDLPDVAQEGIIFVSGEVTVNDGFGGWFKWDALESRLNEDGHDIVDPTGTRAGRGCWIRQKYMTDPPGSISNEIQTAVAGQQDFKLATLRYGIGAGELSIYVNGTRLTPFAFTETASDQVHINAALAAGDVVEFLARQTPGSGLPAKTALQIAFDNSASAIVSRNVQGAITELEQGVGAAGAISPINAKTLAYSPIAPDLSTNVQDALHWSNNQLQSHLNNQADSHPANSITYNNTNSGLNAVNIQQSIDELLTRMGSGAASGISYDNTNSLPLGNTVQKALYKLYLDNKGVTDSFNHHITDIHGAHNASQIVVDSTKPVFNNIGSVTDALDKLADDVDNIATHARSIHFDSDGLPLLGTNVQDALKRTAVDLYGHIDGHVERHQAAVIDFLPTALNRITHNDVQNALEDLEIILDHHLLSTTMSAHDAGEISFQPAVNPYAGSTVEAVLLEIGTGAQVFKGGIDVTQVMPGTPPPPVTPPAAGTSTGLPTGVTDPGMNPLQVGVWADVTAKLDLSTLPVTLANPVTFTVYFSDGTNEVITLPADTYQHLAIPPAGVPLADKSVGMELANDPAFSNKLVGDMLVVSGGNTYLRVDGFVSHPDALTWGTQTGVAPIPAGYGTAYPVSIDVAPPAAPVATAPLVLHNNDYYLISADGTPHASWTIRNLPASGDVTAGDKIIYTGTDFWYVVTNLPQGLTLLNPVASQTMMAPNTTDEALIIAGPTGHTGNLLEVRGDIISSGAIADSQGNLRQTADHVMFSAAIAGLTGNTVETGIAEIMANLVAHENTTDARTKHPADHIAFTPVNHIAASDAQDAIEQVQINLENHAQSPTAHNATGILYSPVSVVIPNARNVQAALEKTWSRLDTYINQAGSSSDSANSVYDPQSSGLAATTVQAALDEIVANMKSLDAGTF